MSVLSLEKQDHWLARASLPSRIIYLMAVANIPMIVMGHSETGAARFVTSLGLGTVCDYSAASFREAVQRVTDEDLSARVRARAAALSPAFSSKGLASWLWESMCAGQPINNQSTINSNH
jgi:UDP:flavonoid glycosyltransferase YjiC (YdhE family)